MPKPKYAINDFSINFWFYWSIFMASIGFILLIMLFVSEGELIDYDERVSDLEHRVWCLERDNQPSICK
jgi:hypothetical protein